MVKIQGPKEGKKLSNTLLNTTKVNLGILRAKYIKYTSKHNMLQQVAYQSDGIQVLHVTSSKYCYNKNFNCFPSTSKIPLKLDH